MGSKEQGVKYLDVEGGPQQRKQAARWREGSRGPAFEGGWKLREGVRWSYGRPPILYYRQSWHTALESTRQEWEGRAWEGLEGCEAAGGEVGERQWAVSAEPYCDLQHGFALCSKSEGLSKDDIGPCLWSPYCCDFFGITSFLWVSPHAPPTPIASSWSNIAFLTQSVILMLQGKMHTT